MVWWRRKRLVKRDLDQVIEVCPRLAGFVGSNEHGDLIVHCAPLPGETEAAEVNLTCQNMGPRGISNKELCLSPAGRGCEQCQRYRVAEWLIARLGDAPA